MQQPAANIAAAVDRAVTQLRSRRAELLEQENILHEIDAEELVRRYVPTTANESPKCTLILTSRDSAPDISELLKALPRQLPNIDAIEWVVVDDGSVDDTTACARRHGADHVLQFPQPRGSRAALAAGVDKALATGADFIVHVDSPTVCSDELAALVRPLVAGEADCVLGEEPPQPALPDRLRQMLLSVADFVSRLANRRSAARRHAPLRAFTRETALHLTQ